MITFDIPEEFGYMEHGLVDALKMVIDPELNINIIDLGLVYSFALNQTEMSIRVEMTLSSKFCPMGESIVSAVKNCIERTYRDFKAEVELVWHPMWNYDFISPAGLSQLKGV